VRVDPSGKVYVFIGVTAQGQGHATTLAQIAADELGADFDDVIVQAGDTTQFPFGMGTGGSRVMANSGPAVAQTAREVKQKAQAVAAELLEAAPADIRIERGKAFVVGVPSKSVTLARLSLAAIKSKALKPLGEPGLNACTYFYPATVTWAFGTQAAVVDVDIESCHARLLAYSVVHDPGRAINPAIVEGQLQGGAVQGLAAGLMEELLYDETSRAWVRAAPSRGRRPSSTRSRTRWLSSTWSCAKAPPRPHASGRPSRTPAGTPRPQRGRGQGEGGTSLA
jgi:carbon-monoxide dehydrogenase large subunit